MIATDADRWRARVLALTTALGVDAVVVLLPVQERFVAYAAHGISGGDALAGVAPAIASALAAPRAVTQAAIPLSDGRVAQELLAVPIRLGDRPLGIFVAVSERHKFGEIHAARVASAAELIAVDLAASNALFHSERSERALERRLAQAEEDRGQALLLYELGRLDAGGERALDVAAAMLADVGRHAVVGIWAVDGTRLVLRAGRGYAAGEHQQVLSDAESGLAAAIRSRAPQLATVAPGALHPAWAPEGASQFILAPIRDDVRDAGLLVLGRDGDPYTEADVEFAALLAVALLASFTLPAAAPVEQTVVLPPAEPAPRSLERAPRVTVAGALLGVALAEALLADGVLAQPRLTADAVALIGWSAYALALVALIAALALLRAPRSRDATRLLFAVALVVFVARGFALLLDPYAALPSLGLRIAEAAVALLVAVLLTTRLRAASARAG